MEEVGCTQYPMKFVYLEGEAMSGCCVLDVNFHTGVRISEICFDNFYTASLTIKVQRTSNTKGRKGEFKTILANHKLMSSPHHANESESKHKINLKMHGSTEQEQDSTYTSMRFILRQPSPRWKTFSIKNLKFYQMKSKLQMTSLAFKEEEKKCEMQPESIEKLRKDLHSLSSMVTLMHQLPESYQPSEFEVDDRFNTNQLTYNSK